MSEETNRHLICNVPIRDYALNMTNLDNLACEFCGKILAEAKSDNGYQVQVVFTTAHDKYVFENALECFKLKNEN